MTALLVPSRKLLLPRRRLLKVLGGAIAAPFVSRAAFGDTPFTSFSYSATGRSNSATSPDRWHDMPNAVRDFGADPTGVSDSTTALTNLIAVLGDVYIPPGTYTVSGSGVALPYSGGGYGSERYRIYGYDATIQGNFAGWLFSRQRGNDNLDPKVIEGLNFKQSNSAGGMVCFNGSTSSFMIACEGHVNGGGMGFIWRSGNGPQGAIGCKLEQDGGGGVVTNTVGIAVTGLGGIVQGCDVHGYDRAIMAGGGGGGGNVVTGNRLEVNNWGVTLGVSADFQFILSSASSNGGSTTRLALSNTLLLATSDTITVTDYSGTFNALSGSWIATVIDATHIDINLTWPGSDLTVGHNFYLFHDTNSGSGITCTGNRFENNSVGIMDFGAQGVIIEGNDMLIDDQSQSGGQTGYAGINLRSNTVSNLIRANNFTGQAVLGAIYYDGIGSPTPFNNDVTNNSVQSGSSNAPIELAAMHVSYTNSSGPFVMYQTPRWMATGQTIFSSRVTFPGGTTITLGSGSFTTSSAFTGTLPAGAGFIFKDSGGTNLVGQVTLV